jgi:hypothetical protein
VHIANGREYEHGSVELESRPEPGRKVYVLLDFGPRVLAEVDAVEVTHRLTGFHGSLACHR